MMKRVFFASLLMAGVMLFGTQSAMAVSIGFSPSSPLVGVTTGDLFDVDIVVSDLGGEIVSAFDLDVTYDASVLNATGYKFASQVAGGGMLGDWSWFETYNNDDTSLPFQNPLAIAGIVDLFETSLLSDAALATLQGGGPVTLATISFKAIADAASTELGFDWTGINDVKGRNNGVIIPGTVPEPASLALLALGLAGMGFSRQRKKA